MSPWLALTNMGKEIAEFARQYVSFERLRDGRTSNVNDISWPRGSWGHVDGAAVFAGSRGGEPLFTIPLQVPVTVDRSDQINFAEGSVELGLDGLGRGAEELLLDDRVEILGLSPKPFAAAPTMPLPEVLRVPTIGV